MKFIPLPHFLGQPQVLTALWLAEEMRKGKKSFWYAWIAMLPTYEDFLQYHPALARYAGKWEHARCLEGGGRECLPPWRPLGDQVSLWDGWMRQMGQCHGKYLQVGYVFFTGF